VPTFVCEGIPSDEGLRSWDVSKKRKESGSADDGPTPSRSRRSGNSDRSELRLRRLSRPNPSFIMNGLGGLTAYTASSLQLKEHISAFELVFCDRISRSTDAMAITLEIGILQRPCMLVVERLVRHPQEWRLRLGVSIKMVYYVLTGTLYKPQKFVQSLCIRLWVCSHSTSSTPTVQNTHLLKSIIKRNNTQSSSSSNSSKQLYIYALVLILSSPSPSCISIHDPKSFSLRQMPISLRP